MHANYGMQLCSFSVAGLDPASTSLITGQRSIQLMYTELFSQRVSDRSAYASIRKRTIVRRCCSVCVFCMQSALHCSGFYFFRGSYLVFDF